MDLNIPVYLVSSKDHLSQKCIIPIKFFRYSNFSIGDYVKIQTSKQLYLCQVQTTVQPLNCILVDNVITFANDYQSKSKDWEQVSLFEDFVHVEPFNFDEVSVKVVFKDNEDVIQCQKTLYEDITKRVLTGCVFGKDCVVNCCSMKFADLFYISHIIILETLPLQYGKLNKSSKVNVIDVMYEEQMNQINKFQQLQLGGIKDYLNILKLNSIEMSARILVLGPSGCGKSSLVQKFCSNTKCFFVIIDGLKTANLTTEKCNSIQKKFSSYLKMFPNKTCILFIDHINAIASSGLKESSSTLFALGNLINHLSYLHIVIIATAIQRSDINLKISSLFLSEVNLGVPCLIQRKEIIECFIKPLTLNTDYDKLWQMTPGFVAHDLMLLVQDAVNNKKMENSEEEDKKFLTIQDFEKALNNISPSILKTSTWFMKVKPVYWKDIGGMVNIKKRLQMCIEWPLRNPEIFKKVDLPCPRGVLVFGPPGCCKTTLARGLATECNANFFAANPAQIYSPYVGESEKNITELFYQARVCAPSIIFLDELDSLVSQRKLDQKSQGIGEKVLSALLNEMDGFGTKIQFQNAVNTRKLLNNYEDSNSFDGAGNIIEHNPSDDVIVVAATNRPDLIDDALLRPGRFDTILYIPPPNEEERESILNTLIKNVPIENVDIRNIAAKTQFFSGADLKSLCNEAKMNALRKDMSALNVKQENFDKALKQVKPSITNQQIEMYEKLLSKYGTVIK